jgi:hypothetical protein
MSDALHDSVNKAVAEMVAGPSKESFLALAPLAELEPEVLLPELFLQVDEASKGFDLRRMKPTEMVPDVDLASDVVNSIVANDMIGLRNLVKGDYSEVVIELLAVVAAMKSPINQDCYIYTDEEAPLREGKQ